MGILLPESRRITLTEIIEALYIFLLVLGSRSLYVHPLYGNYRIQEAFGVVSLALLLLKAMSNDGVIEISDNLLVVLVLYFALVAIYGLLGVSGENMIGYLFRYAVILPINILLMNTYSENGEMPKLLLKFAHLMCIISVISLFFWFLGSLSGIIKPTGNYYSSWGNSVGAGRHRNFYGIYFDAQKIDFFGYSGYRNCSIFTESPMHALVLVFAFDIELFYRKYVAPRLDYRKLMILSITIMTTFSSTGIVLLFLSLALYMYLYYSENSANRLAGILLMAPVVIAIGVAVYTIFSTRSTETISWISRMQGTGAALSSFLKSPIIGTGYGGSDFRQELSLGGLKYAFAFSVANVLAEGGILLSLVYWVPAISVIVRAYKNHEKNIAFFAIMYLIQFSSSSCENAMIMFVLLAVFITYRPEENMELEAS